MTGQQLIEIDEVGKISIVKFLDKKYIEEDHIQLVGNQLNALVDDDHRQKIVLDCSVAEYFSSMMLGKFITLERKVKTAGGKLRFCSVRPDILEVFKITRLDKLFVIRENREKALENF